MINQRGRRWARIALAAVTGGALALAAAAPAAAEDPATGVAKAVPGSSVKLLLDGKVKRTSALAIEIDGKRVPAFCIDYHTNVAIDGTYQEGTWDESQVKNLAKVQWVLTHGHPNADPAALLSAAGAVVPAGTNEQESLNLLYFGTQTAVWHFSDGIVLGDWAAGRGLISKPKYDVIKKVHDYLVGNATDQPEPKAELSIDPTTATATVGEKAGPFTVKGPAGRSRLWSPAGPLSTPKVRRWRPRATGSVLADRRGCRRGQRDRVRGRLGLLRPGVPLHRAQGGAEADPGRQHRCHGDRHGGCDLHRGAIAAAEQPSARADDAGADPVHPDGVPVAGAVAEHSRGVAVEPRPVHLAGLE
ncbi:hypothetical protein GCM10029963_57670 [Micromonospora andamanensis]